MNSHAVIITLWLVLGFSSAGYPANEEISIAAWTIWQAVQRSQTETAQSVRTMCPDWAENRFKVPIGFITRRDAKGFVLLGAFADGKYCVLKGDGKPPLTIKAPESSPMLSGKYQFLHCSPNKELIRKVASVLDNRDKLGVVAASHGYWVSVKGDQFIFTQKYFRARMDNATFKQALGETLGQLPINWEDNLTAKAYELRQALCELYNWSPLGKWRPVPRSTQWQLATKALTSYWSGRDVQVLFQLKMTFLPQG